MGIWYNGSVNVKTSVPVTNNNGIFMGRDRFDPGRKHQTISLCLSLSRGHTTLDRAGPLRTRLASRMPTLSGCQSTHNNTTRHSVQHSRECPTTQHSRSYFTRSEDNSSNSIPRDAFDSPTFEAHRSACIVDHFSGGVCPSPPFKPLRPGTPVPAFVSVDICGGDTRCPRPVQDPGSGVWRSQWHTGAKHFATTGSQASRPAFPHVPSLAQLLPLLCNGSRPNRAA